VIGAMKILLLISASIFQVLIVVMFFINTSWVPLVMIGYALSLGFLIYLLIKDRRNREKEEQNDDDRNY
jgi:phosphotransferase system  glucose/maltose/N-acetylglucosamine-specific IIC component